VAAEPVRIPLTPENREKYTGDYGRWAVVGLALGVLLALILVPPLFALRESGAIYGELHSSQELFVDSQRVFQSLAQNVFSISIAVRDFLLDNSPEAGRRYRSRLETARADLRDSIERLRGRLPAVAAPELDQLQSEVDGYLAVVIPVFDWTPQQRVERAAYFLREEQRPRRDSVLAIAEQLEDVNASLYRDEQRRMTASEARFRQALTRSALFVFVVGLLVSVGGILRMRTLEQRADEHHRQAEETGEEMRSLSVRLRHAQEEERRTISRELHDGVGQLLTAIRMQLGGFARLRTGGQREFDETLADVKAMTERSLRIIRDIAAGLRPSVLDDLGLAAALQRHAREYSARTGIAVSIAVDGDGQRLDDRCRTSIYRIVQEALTNCAKHARAAHVEIGMRETNGQLVLVVRDDGVGFVPAQAVHAGLGLIGIEERARELGGHLEVRSAPGQGTTIQVALPTEAAAG
jgi:signal transduction histidine kinase